MTTQLSSRHSANVSELDKNRNLFQEMFDNYNRQQSQVINRMAGETKDAISEINTVADEITCSAEELKLDSERFVNDEKVNSF